MQREFNQLVDHLTALLHGGEVFTCTYQGETSDFVRFNRSAVRQPGHVTQHSLSVDLIEGDRHTRGQISLAGTLEIDKPRAARFLEELRARRPHVPPDPHLLYSTEIRSGEHHRENRLPRPEDALAAVIATGEGRDLVGIYAAGGIHAGFANSLGQRNWYSTYSFNLDFSFYLEADKAVKLAYAGFEWNDAEFRRKVKWATDQLEVLKRPPRTVAPGRYRVYLAPPAMWEYVGMLSYSAFGLKDRRTKSTSLLKMVEEGARLHPSVAIYENTGDGVAPNFQSQGFIKPDRITLIERGEPRECLVSPRSAKEYGVPTNAASGMEYPESLEMAPGDIPAAEIPRRLGEGIYINNLWYLNYSDRPAARITGMTRFATFWVEGGEIRAPLNVMRFDETAYRCLGEKLQGLTSEREFMLDSGTYEGRSTASARLPGALIEDFTFTL
jgi:predicted Zn-dependent protease